MFSIHWVAFCFLLLTACRYFGLTFFYRPPSTTIKKMSWEAKHKERNSTNHVNWSVDTRWWYSNSLPKTCRLWSVAILRNCCFKTNKFIHNTKQKPQVTDWCNMRQYWTLCLFNKLLKTITLPLSSVSQLTSN